MTPHERAERMLRERGIFRSEQSIVIVDGGTEYRHVDRFGHWLRLYQEVVRLQTELLEREGK